MSDLSPAFRTVLEDFADRLGRELGQDPLRVVLDDRAHRIRVDDTSLRVPIRYEVHWRQFGTLPTELARDAAYEAKRRTQDPLDDMEASLFAEVFVRDHVLNAD